MVTDIRETLNHLEQILDDETEAVSAHLKLPKSKARKKVRKVWLEGCVICKGKGPTRIQFYNRQPYVICKDCYLLTKIERGDEGLRRSIAQRLAHRARKSSSRN